MKPIFLPLVLCAMAAMVPASAQQAPIWGGYYNMGTFAAGGGSETDGHISLECAGDHLDNAGALLLQLTPAAGIEPFADAPPQLDFLIDGQQMALPVTAEDGAVFFYRSGPGDRRTLTLIDALRRGHMLIVSAPELDIAEISLGGSFEALTYVAACVAGNDQ